MTIAEPNLTDELQSLADALADIRRRVEVATSGDGEKALLWSPHPKQWSMAQVLEHLNRVGGGMMPGIEIAVDKLLSENRRSEGPFRYSFMERMFIRMLSPNPPIKMPVPPVFEPPLSEAELTDALPRFLALQDSLLESMRRASGLDLKAERIPSLINGKIKLCLGAWFHAIVAHEQYHLLQIEALKADPAFPSTKTS